MSGGVAASTNIQSVAGRATHSISCIKVRACYDVIIDYYNCHIDVRTRVFPYVVLVRS